MAFFTEVAREYCCAAGGAACRQWNDGTVRPVRSGGEGAGGDPSLAVPYRLRGQAAEPVQVAAVGGVAQRGSVGNLIPSNRIYGWEAGDARHPPRSTVLPLPKMSQADAHARIEIRLLGDASPWTRTKRYSGCQRMRNLGKSGPTWIAPPGLIGVEIAHFVDG